MLLLLCILFLKSVKVDDCAEVFHYCFPFFKIIERFGLLETFKGHLVQAPCNEQGHFQSVQVIMKIPFFPFFPRGDQSRKRAGEELTYSKYASNPALHRATVSDGFGIQVVVDFWVLRAGEVSEAASPHVASCLPM